MFKKVLLTVGLFFVLPAIACAALPGARSASNDVGDVFLGGNYIEVGVSKNGSFGTSTSAPVSFGSHTRNSGTGPLGLISDGDGWDNGNMPTSGDFFLPGTPEERWAIAYMIDGVSYQVHAADRMANSYSGFSSYTNLFETVDQSDVSNNILKAYVSGVTNENVKVELTYSFDVNDKYYNTEVKITNLGDKPITDVRFLRSFDPDQDSWTGGESQTYNKVICNPDSSKEGGEDNFAMVVGRGGTSLDGFFFVSFDNRARVSRGVAFEATNVYDGGFWVDKTEGLPTYATEESIEMTKENTNGYILEDLAVSIEFKLDTIDAGKNSELNYYSSLDPNVLSSINNIIKAVAAKVKNLSDTRIEVETKEGYEYSIDGGEHWQDSGVFEGLEPGKEYTVLSRLKAVGETPASEPEETSVTTKNSSKDTPDVMEVIVTEDEITIETVPGYEYSIDGGEHWQSSPTFTGLKPNTEYTIIARYKETNSDMPGKPTDPIVIRTPEKIKTALDDVTNVEVKVEVGADTTGIVVHKGLLYEAIMDDEDVKEIVESGHNAKIVFDVEALTLSEEELNEIKEQVSGDEIAFVVDAKLTLYADGIKVKDITSSGKKITFTLKVPKEYIKKGRNFSIVRKHTDEDGNVEYEILRDEDMNDETITISSDRFSEFTVVYKDIKNPKTGDNVLSYVLILVLSVSSLYLCKRLES